MISLPSLQEKIMQNTEQLSLKVNEPLIVKADRVVVESGLVWLTQTGHLRDVLLYAGQSYAARRAGRIVIQALAADTRVILQSTTLGFRLRKLIAAVKNAVRSRFRFGYVTARAESAGRGCA
jgi:hypothetical protein